MSTTMLLILFMILLFAGIFYYTHREPEQIESATESNNTADANLNGTPVVTKLTSGAEFLAGKIRQGVPAMPTELGKLSSLPESGIKRLRIWQNGSAKEEAVHSENMFQSNGSGPQHQESAESEDETPPGTSLLSEALNGWNIFAQEEDDLSPQFKAWMSNTTLKKRIKRLPESARAMKSWLASLEEEEVAILTKQISTFASDLNFELGWLFDKEFDGDANLKLAIEEVVTLYCLANFKALLLQDELKTFIMFQAWQEEPTSKEHRDFNQKLFNKLVDKELAQGVPSELLLADEEQRAEYAVQAIRKVMQEDRKTFNVILKQVMLEEEAEEVEEPKEPSEQSEPELAPTA